ncbi:hypothetical protein AMK24_31510 [Streptomyces sp. CB02366]|nr:hypothetical protein AMK24_31510 [Streptomyces sp. CB02366]
MSVMTDDMNFGQLEENRMTDATPSDHGTGVTPSPPLPPPVRADTNGSLLTYWQDRMGQHVRDSYAGVRLMKFPEDLRTYEHALWLSRAQVVVELGTHSGGSALWFRDRLRTMASYGRIPEDVRVITLDLDQERARSALAAADRFYAQQVVLLEADLLDASTAPLIAEHLPPGARCLVVEDSQHAHATTLAGLRHCASLVSPGSFYVVEDAVVDHPELCVHTRPPGPTGGVTWAVEEWFSTPASAGFSRVPDMNPYGVSCKNIWLWREVERQRVAPPAP